jgi:CRP/FNR family transcriptional regulator, anaerobic regulatory protein
MPKGAERHKPAKTADIFAPQLPAIVQSGALSILEADAKTLIVRHMVPLKLLRGQKAFRAGDAAHNYFVVKSGSIKVLVTTESGREIVLYHVGTGETCVLTTTSLLSGANYEAEAVAEVDTEAIILPKPAFEELLAASPKFRQFVFTSYGERLHTLIGLVQEVAVRQVDRRLARLLLKLEKGGRVDATHQALAQELNTAREVVTRLLHDFAAKGHVEISRGLIRILEVGALIDLAGDM